MCFQLLLWVWMLEIYCFVNSDLGMGEEGTNRVVVVVVIPLNKTDVSIVVVVEE